MILKIRFGGAAAVVALALLAWGCGEDVVAPATFQVQLSATPTSISGNGTSTITAQVTNNLGQTPSSVSLEWSNSLGLLQVTSGNTDSNGRSTATLVGQGDTGVATVTAKMLGRTEQGQVQVRIE